MDHDAMTRETDPIFERAAEWHAASDRDDFDWDGLTTWLEADPRHARAYDEVALADALVAEHAAELAVMADPKVPAGSHGDNVVALAPRWRTWPMWAGSAVAAALVAMVAVPRFSEPAPQVYTTASAARTISLADGSRIVLAPRSRLEVKGRDAQQMVLAGGAWFDVRHDPARQLAITVGDETIRDVGTQFDVQNTTGELRVTVAEGALSVASETLDQPVRLAAGRKLVLDRSGHTATVSAADPAAVGTWRSGRLTYEQTPLRLVVADLARYAGLKVEVDRAIADRRFSGTLIIGHGDEAVRDLSQVMGLALDAGRDGYRLRAATR